MHIVAFCHYYPPEVNAPASRLSEHAKVWVAIGHEVTVITCAPNHPKGQLYPGYRNRFFQREVIDGVNVVRVWSYLAANAGFLPRILNYITYILSALIALPRLKRPDVILTTSPQFFCGLAGLPARLMRRAPWVFEVRDLWPESIVTVGAMKKGRVIRFLEWLECVAYRKADRVVSVTDGFVPHIAQRRGTEDGILVIKNGVDLDRFAARDPNKGRSAKARFGLEGRVIAAYVGTHGMAHGLDIVLDAAQKLRDDDRIGFLLVGDGSERERLVARAEEMKLDNIRIVGQLPKSDMPAIWSATDVSLILLRRIDTFKTVLPSKMFEAMAMQCPIVLGVEGEACALLKAANAGIAITPEDSAQLAEAVRTLAYNSATAAAYGENGLTHVTEYFDRSAIARRYLDLLHEVAG